MIPVSSSARMRKGIQGLSLLVQESLGRDPFAGDVIVFRGRGGSLIKALWHDGSGLSLYAKRLVSNARLHSNLHFKRTEDPKDVVEPHSMLDMLRMKIAASGT